MTPTTQPPCAVRQAAILWGLAAVVMTACVDDTSAVSPSTTLTGQGAELLVVGTDYATTSLSWVDPQQPSAVAPGFLHSGSAVTAAGSALSGDVVPGSGVRGDGAVPVLDRFRSTLTWVGAGPVRQWALSDGFLANPQDAWALPGGETAVARAQADPQPTSARLSGGDDVLVLSAAGEPVRRLPLGQESTLDGGFAFPGRGALDAGALWLPLASLARDFSAAGPGRVVRVDLDEGVTDRLAVPGLRNCTRLAWATGAAVLVGTCSGFFQDPPDLQRQRSGVFVIDPASRSLTVRVSGASLPAGGPVAPPIQQDASGRGWFVRYGKVGGAPDSLWRYDVTGQVSHVMDSHAPFTIGDLWLDGARDRLWLTAAKAVGGDLVALGLDDGAPVAQLVVHPGGLPAVHLAWRVDAPRRAAP